MITSVTGRADLFDLSFKNAGGGTWTADVPRDADGRYACEIWLENDRAEVSYWSGWLYVTDGRFVCLHLANDTVHASMIPERATADMVGESVQCNMSAGRFGAIILDERTEIQILRRCSHGTTA